MKYLSSLITVLILLAWTSSAFAQEEDEGLIGIEDRYDTPLTVDLDTLGIEEGVELKKKKVKKNVFYGYKTVKGYTKKGFGNNAVWEQFHYLKEYQEPIPYVRDTYWYHKRKKKIQKGRKIDKDNAGILHGPYKKLKGKTQLLEEGIFFLGVKHGRWMRWNKHDILQSKEKYYKGWPKESKVVYHDVEKKKLKEITPIHYGEKEGYYFAFHESGNLAAYGQYKFDNKVGIWREFYDKRRKRKRETIYPKDPFDDEFKPYIAKEWNKKGKLIYEKKRR